jgi:hypothetical protein
MTLTVGLAILAGVVLLGVVVQGAWAARKAVPRALPGWASARSPRWARAVRLGPGADAGRPRPSWPSPPWPGRRPPAAAPHRR